MEAVDGFLVRDPLTGEKQKIDPASLVTEEVRQMRFSVTLWRGHWELETHLHLL